MSHYTVLVAAADEAELDKRLLPYHEYECTGLEEYTERLPPDLDEAEEDFAKYANKPGAEKQTFDEFIQDWYGLDEKDRDGLYRRQSNHRQYAWFNQAGRLLYHAYDDVALPGLEFPAHEGCYPDGETYISYDYRQALITDASILLEFLTAISRGREPLHGSVAKAVSRKREHVQPAGLFRPEDLCGPLYRQFVKGSKWDWFTVGGRWTGLLHLKQGAQGSNGKPGLQTAPNSDPSKADIALAGDVDWPSMRQEEVEQVRKQWMDWQSLPPKEEAEARTRAIFDRNMLFLETEKVMDIESGISESDYMTKYALHKALTFAYIDTAGRWVERGSMGWWATVSEKNDDYDRQWWQFAEGLPAGQRVFAVDCHI